MAFNFTNSSDRLLFEQITNEAIKIYGIDVIYYTTEFNANKEPIFSEDSKPKLTGEYKIKVYTQAIQEDWILSRFGLGSNDLLVVNIDDTEFRYSVGDFEPKAGDYIWIKYMNRLFIVTDVDKEDAIFLEKKFLYSIKLKAADIQGEEIDTVLETITNYENLADLQNDNSAITIAASGIVKDKIGDMSIFGAFE